MSITTKTGDDGTTGIMYGHRVSKRHPRVMANGAVDELNAALGMARVRSGGEPAAFLESVQKELVVIMGEIAVLPADRERYVAQGFPVVTPAMVARLDERITAAEASGVKTAGWDTPGSNEHNAALHVARAACRRAEREVCGVAEELDAVNPNVTVYLNRLSDLLWLMAQNAG